MNPGNDIVKELEELASPLAMMQRVTPFQVPEDYFTTLTNQINASLIYEEEPVLELPREIPYEAPQGYFEGLAASIMEKVSEEPAFGSIEAPSFEVPAGYFERLPQQILTAAKAAAQPSTVEQKPTRVVSFMPRKALQWAAAACLIAAVGFGGYKMINPEQPSLSAERQLAQLDKDLIKSYVAQHIDEFDTEMLAEHSPILNSTPEKNIHKLNKADIKEYLDEDEGI